jgi:hypothetical protein
MSKIAEHLVATTRNRDRSLLEPERASWLWTHLQAGFPDALSCVFMPDHLHLVAAPHGEARFRRVLTAFTQCFAVKFDILDPEPANSPAIVGRMIRYGLFNPTRANLIDDPFAWTWSTLRDLVGACHPVWTPLSRVASTLRLSSQLTLRTLTTVDGHSYAPPTLQSLPTAGVAQVRLAVRSALRIVTPITTLSATERRLVVETCFHIGAPRVDEIAAQLGCSVRSIHRDRATHHPALDAVLLCLTDPRLLRDP